MNRSPYACQRHLIAGLLACSAGIAVQAQQAPLTGQMLAPTTPTAVAEHASPPLAPSPMPSVATDNATMQTQVGDVTRQLLTMQSQGTHAGKHLPIPGQEASASYQRYLKSFEHPIPEFYDAAVSKSAGMSSTSSSP
ncbi:DUF3613 domain-containing protein [Dyella japonica]|uniref:DUF3613 domain-containing protein n=1 Tax=Dyella japonica TaxID=231455 RepID=A0ABV2JXU6_9GAMM